MTPEVKVTLTATGLFFLAALGTGAWKYRHMLLNDDHRAPVYVDVAHRAALLYSFAGVLLTRFVEESPLPRPVTLVAVLLPLVFFALAIGTYVQLGLRNHTDNQFRERNFGTTWAMGLLIAAEMGGFLVLFAGFVYRAWLLPAP
jgi:hypothetical protein